MFIILLTFIGILATFILIYADKKNGLKLTTSEKELARLSCQEAEDLNYNHIEKYGTIN